MADYSAQFYAAQRAGSRRSAEVIVPLVLDLVRPSSVVDVGCGVGTWLAAFYARGIDDILGIDGAYAQVAGLEVPPERFLASDLTKPIAISRTFDLVVSLEVGEHLPLSVADTFVTSLTRLGPVILFSAAIPGQGGVHHVNEQWPSFWARKFRTHGFVAVDALRRRIWKHPDVQLCYAQNTLLFVRGDKINDYPRLAVLWEGVDDDPLPLVHPRLFNAMVEQLNKPTLRPLLRALCGALSRSVRHHSRLLWKPRRGCSRDEPFAARPNPALASTTEPPWPVLLAESDRAGKKADR